MARIIVQNVYLVLACKLAPLTVRSEQNDSGRSHHPHILILNSRRSNVHQERQDFR